MSKPVYLDFLGKRDHIYDAPDDYQIGADEATAALAYAHAKWLSVEAVTEDAEGIYVRAQLVVTRALLSPRFWLGILREGVWRVLNWKIG